MLSFLYLAITNGLCQDIAPPDEPSSFFSVLAMKKERPQRAREPGAAPPSLRDYWMKPTGFPGDQPRQPTRRTALPVTTPSLWEQTPLLSPFSASPLAPTQESKETLGAEPLLEETPAPSSGNETLMLRQRVQRRGVDTLSTAELLSLLLRTSARNERMNQHLSALLREQGGLAALLKREFGELSTTLGETRAAQLQATLEVARRLTLPPDEEPYTIRSPADVAALVKAEMEFLDHEQLRVLVLDTKNRVMLNTAMYKGTLNSSVLRAAEIFRPAITRKCPNVIVCHNHPSGDPTPSPEDIAVTEQLVQAGKVLDVELLDHLVIGHNNRFISLKERLRW